MNRICTTLFITMSFCLTLKFLFASTDQSVDGTMGRIELVGLSVSKRVPAIGYESIGEGVCLTFLTTQKHDFIIAVNEALSTVLEFTDDFGTDLSRDSCFQRVPYFTQPDYPQPTGHDMLFGIDSPTCPMKEAKQIKVKGRVSILCGTDLREYRQQVLMNQVAALKGGPLKMGTVGLITDGESATRVKLTGLGTWEAIKSIKEVRFVSSDGRSIDIESDIHIGGDDQTSSGAVITMEDEYTLKGNAEQIQVVIEYYATTRYIVLPIDVVVSVGF